MSSGRTHENVSTIVIFTTLPLSMYYLGEFRIDSVIVHLSSLFGTYYLNPDCDLSRSRPINNWKFLKFLMLPYSGMNPHRGRSHKFLIGTIDRFLYLLTIIIFPILVLITITLYFFGCLNFQSYKESYLIGEVLFKHIGFVLIDLFVGLFNSDNLHLIMDRKKRRK